MSRHYRSYSSRSENQTVYGILERVADLSNVRLIEPEAEWRSYRSKPVYPANLSTGYGDWKEVTDYTPLNPSTVFLFVNYASGSDYSGDLVEVSNHKALLDMLPPEYEDGIEYLNYHGGFGGFGLAIRLDSLTDDILEAIESLDDYPVLDESLHSELENEAQNEAWESDIRSDFRKELGKYLFAVWESSWRADQQEGESYEAYEARINAVGEFLTDECGDINDSNLAELFYKLMDSGNTYWTNEQGSSCWIDAKEVLERGLESRKHETDWHKQAVEDIKALIRSSMSDTKYDLGILRYIDPNQLALALVTSEVN